MKDDILKFCVINNIYNSAGVKKFPLVPRASKVKFLLVLLPNNLSEIYCQKYFHRTLGENICLSCLKFNLTWAPGQMIFYPCSGINVYVLIVYIVDAI